MFKAYYDSYKAQFIAAVEALDFAVVETILERMEQARLAGKRVFVIGNGGSATSASHWACDFGKGVNVEGVRRFRVASLTDNLAWLTALGNDMSYDEVFREQMLNELHEGDLVIGLSVSGNSENVIRAFQCAKEAGAEIIALVGSREGRMKELADVALVIPSADYGIVEDIHMFVNHVISQHLKQTFLRQKEAGEAEGLPGSA